MATTFNDGDRGTLIREKLNELSAELEGGIADVDQAVIDAQQSASDAESFRDETASIKSDFEQAFGGLSYLAPVEYASGINIDSAVKTVEFDGDVYAPLPSEVPFTTSGTFEVDKFRLIQGVTTQQMASTAAGGFAANIGRNVIAVDSIADLLALPAGARRGDLRYLVKGYYAGSDVGGGEFYWDAASTAADNGGTVFEVSGVATGRFVRRFEGSVDVTWFGAKGDGVTSDSAAFIAAESYLDGMGGGDIVIPSGDFPVRWNIQTDKIRVVASGNPKLRAAGSGTVLEISSDDVTIIGPIKISGQTLADELNSPPSNNTTALHCIRINGYRSKLVGVSAEGARYDTLYFRTPDLIYSDAVFEDCYFGPTGRNTVSIINGLGLRFYKCVFESSRAYQGVNNQLYLFDAEPGDDDGFGGFRFYGCKFIRGHDGDGRVIFGDPKQGDSNVDIVIDGCEFSGSEGSSSIRLTTADLSGINVYRSRFDDRIFSCDSHQARTLYNSSIEDVVTGNNSITFNLTFGEGCYLKNITSSLGGPLSIVGYDSEGVIVQNAQGLDDRVNGNMLVSGELTVEEIVSNGTRSNNYDGSAVVSREVNGLAERITCVKSSEFASGTEDLLVISIDNFSRVSHVWEVIVQSQAAGSSAARRQRSTKITFMVTAGNAAPPVVDIISSAGWDETLSSSVTGGNRDPVQMDVTVSVNVNNEIVVSATTGNTLGSGVTRYIVYATGYCRVGGGVNVQ